MVSVAQRALQDPRAQLDRLVWKEMRDFLENEVMMVNMELKVNPDPWTVAGDDANVEAPGFGPKDYSAPSSTESSSQEPEKPYAEQAPVRVSKREQARNLRRKLVI
ncbi:unnamed protein product, partial [Mesorhabditis spiculigera]